MGAKMQQRRRQNRKKRLATERRENLLFVERGEIPVSARSVSICPCGAIAFSRAGWDDLADFDAAHTYCATDWPPAGPNDELDEPDDQRMD